MTTISRRRFVTTLAGAASGVVAGVITGVPAASSRAAPMGEGMRREITKEQDKLLLKYARRRHIPVKLLRRAHRLGLSLDRTYELKKGKWSDFQIYVNQENLEIVLAGLEASGGFKALPHT